MTAAVTSRVRRSRRRGLDFVSATDGDRCPLPELRCRSRPKRVIAIIDAAETKCDETHLRVLLKVDEELQHQRAGRVIARLRREKAFAPAGRANVAACVQASTARLTQPGMEPFGCDCPC